MLYPFQVRVYGSFHSSPTYVIPISGTGVRQFPFVTNLCYTHFRYGCTAVSICHQPTLYPFQVRVYGSFHLSPTYVMPISGTGVRQFQNPDPEDPGVPTGRQPRGSVRQNPREDGGWFQYWQWRWKVNCSEGKNTVYDTANVVTFAAGKFCENVAKTFHVGVIFTILHVLLFPS